MKTIHKIKIFYDGADSMEADANHFLASLDKEHIKAVTFCPGPRVQSQNAILIHYTEYVEGH